MDDLEQFDKAKTKVLKYIIYKKRTEHEVRQKFEKEFDEDMFEKIIEYLKEAKYIDDSDYIERAINNFRILKNMSNVELKYKLMSKGINNNLIEDYFYENREEIKDYEVNSAKNIIGKKRKEMEDQDIKIYLMKKGYRNDSIKQAFENFE